jgi:hypothetical protein
MSDLFSSKAAKLVRLLSSPVDGEALNALRSLGRAMAEAKLDHHWLADLVERAWSERTTPPPRRWQRWHRQERPAWGPEPEPERMPWQAQAETLLRDHDGIIGMRGSKLDQKLRDRELSFLTNMRKSRTAPSDFQDKWLNDIANRVRRAA